MAFVTYTDNGTNTPDGTHKDFTYTFPIISTDGSDVKVALNGVVQATTKYAVSISPAKITFNGTSVDTNVQAADGAPLTGVTVRVFRDTQLEDADTVTFVAGSSIRAQDLNANFTQTRYALQEEQTIPLNNEDISDGAITSAKIQDLTIVAADIADATITGAKLVNDTVTATQIAADAIGASELADNSVASANIIDGTIVNADINANLGLELTKLEDVNSSKIIVGNGSNKAAQVDMSGDITITNAGVTTIGADAVQIGNISDTETTLTADSDTKIPTSKAVADHVVDVVNSIGGFVVVADKDNFPTSNPDPNNDSGTVLSITNPNGLTVTSGTSSNGTRTGVSDTVSITGIPTDAGSTLTANYTMLVQTTSNPHEYTFYKFLAKDGDVLSLSNDINDFAARYRVLSSAPGTDNDEGDLYFDTSANKMYVYDGSAWGQVTSTGEFKDLTVVDQGQTTGSPTFGSNTSFDLRDGSSAASITNRNQLLVVLNGVVQKSNSGTYSSSEEGFYLEGTDGIKFCTAPPADSTIFVTLIGSAVSLPNPGDETVTEAKLNANAPTNDHVLTADSSAAGGFKWAEGVSEGTQVKSTGESTAGLYLGTDGDGTCSWQNNNSYSDAVTFNNDVTFTTGTTNKNLKWDTDGAGAGDLKFNDGVTATWGDDSDLTIKEDSNQAWITAKSGGKIHFGHGSSNNQVSVGDHGVGNAALFSNGNTEIGNHGWLMLNSPQCVLKFQDSANLKTVGFKAASTIAADVTWELPSADAVSSGQALTSNAAGTLSWSDVSSTVADSCLYENDQTISNAYTIAAGKGAHSVGPITLNATVTVNGRWVIS